VRETYETTLRGKPGNVQKALAHRPEMLKNFLSFYASIGRSLDRKLYELIICAFSFINRCRYRTQHHMASSKRAGLAANDWTALQVVNFSRYSEKELAAFTYAEKLTRAPHESTQTDFDEIYLITKFLNHSMPHRISLSSPTRLVTLSRSRCSSSGIAYLRETPVSSLNLATSICADFALYAPICRRNSLRALR
jgi:AhpD family alkylhydroperoxidase